jgi:hypothetical protein
MPNAVPSAQKNHSHLFGLDSVRELLIHLNLRFADSSEEQSFFESFAFTYRPLLQCIFISGGMLAYVFFIWDQIIDPAHASATHLIRGLGLTPIICLAAVPLFFKRLDPWYEYMVLFVTLLTGLSLCLIFSLLKGGFNFGAAGYVLMYYFVFALIPLRTPILVAFALISWISFDVFEFASNNAAPGMFIVNNLFLSSSVLVGMLSAVAKEYSARQQFRTLSELKQSRMTVGQLERSNKMLKKTAQRLLDTSGASLLISYRRSDSEAITGRIRDRLASHFGEEAVFIDIDNIPFGLDFREQIALAISGAEILLVVIGPNWISEVSHGHTRILDEDDPVRVEIEAALQRNIAIMPVLVGGATMPGSDQLPPSLKELSYRNAIEVDGGRDFHRHVDRLIHSMEFIIDKSHRAC